MVWIYHCFLVTVSWSKYRCQPQKYHSSSVSESQLFLVPSKSVLLPMKQQLIYLYSWSLVQLCYDQLQDSKACHWTRKSPHIIVYLLHGGSCSRCQLLSRTVPTWHASDELNFSGHLKTWSSLDDEAMKPTNRPKF